MPRDYLPEAIVMASRCLEQVLGGSDGSQEVIERTLSLLQVIVENCSWSPEVIESMHFRWQEKTYNFRKEVLNVPDSCIEMGAVAAQGGLNNWLLGTDGHGDAHGGLCTPSGAGTLDGWNLHESAPETDGSHCGGLNNHHEGLPQVVAL